MIESLAVAELVGLVLDDPRIARGLAIAGQTTTSRLRQLGTCIWLRCGARIAVFKPEFGGHWTAIALDVDLPEFVSECFGLMFSNPRCDLIRFTTPDADGGALFGAERVGELMDGSGTMWMLSQGDWQGRGRHMCALSPVAQQ